MACCKITKGICATALDCDNSIIGGSDDLRIAVDCSIDVVTETNCDAINSREVTGITMDTLGDPDHTFYQFSTSDDTLKFEFDWNFDPENKSKVYTETVTGRLAVRSSAALCALDELMGKEVVILLKENGDTGKWIISGLGGDLYLTNATGGTGEVKTDSTETTITITGELDKRWMYVNWAAGDDEAATLIAIDAITTLC